jgi:NADPH-dependent ferric siderophore reductase
MESTPRTSLLDPEQQLAACRTWLTVVREVEEVHPALRRITFARGDLDSFQPLAPDTFLYVLAPPPGHETLTVDRSFTWDAYRAMPEHLRPVGAYYTVRHWRPEASELEMLFVLHEHGAASDWARRAAPGDPVALWGPRSSFDPPAGTDAFVLVADETGLPAAAAIIESLDDGVPVHLVAEAADAHARQPIPPHDGLTVTWLNRDRAGAGTASLLADAVRALPELSPATYAWGGGESHTMTAARRHLRDVRGLPLRQVSMVAYWRHQDHPTDDEA